MKTLALTASVILFGFGALYAYSNRSQIKSLFNKAESGTTTTEQSSPINPASVNEALETYLPKRIIVADPGAHVFCSKHLYGYEENKNNAQVSVYVWAYCEEYFLKDDTVTMGQGVSFPVKVFLKVQNGKLIATSHEEPVDGYDYANSIRKMFPEDYAAEAVRGYDIAKFKPSPEEQAKTFYNK